MSLLEALVNARETGDFGPVVALVPYASFMGISAKLEDGTLIGTMKYAEHIVGNTHVDALHGGALGALMESTAIFRLLYSAEIETLPKIVNITIEFVRTAHRRDTFARAEITRQGRRVANVRVVAWQESPDKPVAAATAHFLLK